MEEREQKHINSIVGLLYQKGYRGPFTMCVLHSGRPMRSGELRGLFQQFFGMKKGSIEEAELTTHAPYNAHLECRMKVVYTEKDGFKIRGLQITNRKTREQRQLYFNHNQELPGSMTIEGFFPKPKPWYNFLKGKGFGP